MSFYTDLKNFSGRAIVFEGVRLFEPMSKHFCQGKKIKKKKKKMKMNKNAKKEKVKFNSSAKGKY